MTAETGASTHPVTKAGLMAAISQEARAHADWLAHVRKLTVAGLTDHEYYCTDGLNSFLRDAGLPEYNTLEEDEYEEEAGSAVIQPEPDPQEELYTVAGLAHILEQRRAKYAAQRKRAREYAIHSRNHIPDDVLRDWFTQLGLGAYNPPWRVSAEFPGHVVWETTENPGDRHAIEQKITEALKTVLGPHAVATRAAPRVYIERA